MYEPTDPRPFVLLALVAAGLAWSEPVNAQTVSPEQAAKAAQSLAARLEASPSVATWLTDPSKEATYQSDVNQLSILASLLAHELSIGKTKTETRSLYADLRDAGVRILMRANASPEMLPRSDAKAYRILMSDLERFYTE